MSKSSSIVKIHPDSFRINLYTVTPFRMIGLIDVDIAYVYGIERVTLAFYSSSGTNSGKIKDLWYPIVGIKTTTGDFIEFTSYINFVLSCTTKDGIAPTGWLAKSLFFYIKPFTASKLRGFASGTYYDELLDIGKTLRDFYDFGEFYNLTTLNPTSLNNTVTASSIYPGNTHTQKSNYDNYIRDIFTNAHNFSN